MAPGKRVEIRLSPSLVAAIDEWRRQVSDLPPRAEAVVRLVEIGLKEKKKPKPEPKK
jgi:hypothetical protein